jgi:flagellar hook protein FlgE
MSILGALNAAISGLNANSNALGIISDNIANANTVGYKDVTTDFSSLVTQSGITGDYSPGGVKTQPLYNIAQQGAIQGASSPTDLAISGGGFFVVNSNAGGTTAGGSVTYTRAGGFTVDANGNLVNAAGLFLQGQTLSAAQAAAIAAGGTPTLSGSTVTGLDTVNVNGVGGTASATANVTIAANLPANSATAQTMTTPVFDSLGVEHDLTLTFTPTSTANQYKVTAALANAGSSTATITSGDDIVQFKSDGSLDTTNTKFNAANALSIGWDSTVTGAKTPQTLSFNVAGMSQLGSNFTVSSINQDGTQFGSFSSVSIDNTGLVSAHFSNGLARAIAIIPLATFENPDGLTSSSGGSYSESGTSGQPLLAQAGTGAAGQIQPSSLEGSTVDIANEFSQLIIAQNAYSANAKVISSADQMEQALLAIQTQ